MFKNNKIPQTGEESGYAAPVVGGGPDCWLRERLVQGGPGALSDGELLALVMGPGGPITARDAAQAVLDRGGGIQGLLRQRAAVLARVPGMGPGRTLRLLAALECGRRAMLPNRRQAMTVTRPEDLHPLLLAEFRGLDRERFLALYLDTRHRLLEVQTVSIGSLNLSVVHPREVFKLAVGVSAAAVIVAHNHPSGCARPSLEDLELTGRLDRCGELLGIPLLDHLVAGEDRIVSIREYGWPAAGGA